MTKIKLVQDMNLGIKVMQSAANWMQEAGLNPSKWWKPKNMNAKFLLKHTEPEEYFVITVNGKPAAAMVLQDNERNQSWKSIDQKNPKQALYLHWICVHRDYASQGFPEKLVTYANQEAKKRRINRLRLDTDANNVKLCKIYKNLGFRLMGTQKEDYQITAFFEKHTV